MTKYEDEQAREMYLLGKSTVKGIDMIKSNHIRVKDINSDMKLFKEVKDDKTISTYFNRIEIQSGNQVEVIKL